MIAFFTLASRILGLIRDAVCLSYFGTIIWHYFSVPFQLPNLFRRLFGEGALSAALIPVYSERLHNDPAGADRLVHRVLTLLSLWLSSLTLAGVLVVYACLWAVNWSDKTQFVFVMAALMLPYMIQICLVAAMGGVLNVHRHFATPAAAPILLNACIIVTVLFLAHRFTQSDWEQIIAVALAILAAGFLQLAIQLPALKRAGVSIRADVQFRDPDLKKILRLMGPMVVGLAAVQLNTLMDSVIALGFSATPATGPDFELFGYTIAYPLYEGSASHLYCAQRMYQFPLGVFGLALATAIFPSLSEHAARKDKEAFSGVFNQGMRLALFIGLPALAGLILVRYPLLGAVFERKEFSAADTHESAVTLMYYSMGVASYFLQQLFVRAFYAHHDSVTPVRMAIKMIVLNFVLNLVLIWFLGVGGLALSTAISASLQALLLLVMLRRMFGITIERELLAGVGKVLLATVIMSAAGFAALQALASQSSVLQLAVGVPVCAGVYAVTAFILKIRELKLLFQR